MDIFFGVQRAERQRLGASFDLQLFNEVLKQKVMLLPGSSSANVSMILLFVDPRT